MNAQVADLARRWELARRLVGRWPLIEEYQRMLEMFEKQMDTYFPLLIRLVGGDVRMVSTPSDIPSGRSFVVIKTRVEDES